MRLERIPEEDQKIDLAFCDLRPDLLIAAQRPTLEFVNGEAKFLFQERARGTGGIHLVMG